MADQLNTTEFWRVIKELDVGLGRFEKRAEELHTIEYKELNKNWKEALESSPHLQASLMTKALGFFDKAMNKVIMETTNSNRLLQQVIAVLPKINEEG